MWDCQQMGKIQLLEDLAQEKVWDAVTEVRVIYNKDVGKNSSQWNLFTEYNNTV